MKQIFLHAFFGFILFGVLACQKEDTAPQAGVEAPALEGTWQVTDDQGRPEVELKVYPDSRFHVDVHAMEGIEVEGHLEIQEDTVTFINDAGSDAPASDPSPGIYRYTLEGDDVQFEIVNDPLDRRAKFLAKDWTRTES